MQGVKEEKIRQKDVEDLEMHVYVLGNFKTVLKSNKSKIKLSTRFVTGKFSRVDRSGKEPSSPAVSSSQKEIDISEIVYSNLA